MAAIIVLDNLFLSDSGSCLVRGTYPLSDAFEETRQIFSGTALRRLRQFRRGTFRHHQTTLFPRAGSYIGDPVARGHDSHIVLYDDYRIAGLYEPI